MRRRLVILLVAVPVVLLVAVFFLVRALRDSETKLMSVEDFVAAVHVHGMRFADAHRYPPETTDQLLGWLEDPAREGTWPNVVSLVGMIGRGEDGDVDRLAAFLARESSTPLSMAEYQAKQNCLLALGYLVALSGNQKALQYLLGSTEPSQWGSDRIRWTSPFQETVAVVRRQFSRMGIIGLGLTGSQTADDRLVELRKGTTADPVDQEFRDHTHEVLNEAIQNNRFIRDHGLAAYYAGR